jgi:hypothetical protein
LSSRPPPGRNTGWVLWLIGRRQHRPPTTSTAARPPVDLHGRGHLVWLAAHAFGRTVQLLAAVAVGFDQLSRLIHADPVALGEVAHLVVIRPGHSAAVGSPTFSLLSANSVLLLCRLSKSWTSMEPAQVRASAGASLYRELQDRSRPRVACQRDLRPGVPAKRLDEA